MTWLPPILLTGSNYVPMMVEGPRSSTPLKTDILPAEDQREGGVTVADETNPKDLVGAKKPRLSLIPPSSLIYQALAMQDGAQKYGPYNWRDTPVSFMIYLDAIGRHAAQLLDGEWVTEDSKIPHLCGILGSAGIIADAYETGNLIDDRPKRGAATKLILEWTKR